MRDRFSIENTREKIEIDITEIFVLYKWNDEIRYFN